MSDSSLDLLTSRLGHPIPGGRTEIRYMCPLCDSEHTSRDHKHCLYVNTDNRKWFCQRCRKGGDLEYLFKTLHLPFTVEHALEDLDRLLHELYADLQEPAEVPCPIPPVRDKLSAEAQQYLLSRRFTQEEILWYGIRDGDNDPDQKFYLQGRIVIPDKGYDGVLNYWAARTYKGHKNKYYNVPIPRASKLFGYGRLNPRLPVVIVEGPISKIAADRVFNRNVVGAYGKYVTRQQFDMLVALDAPEYIAMADGDASDVSVAIARTLYARGASSSIAWFEKKGDDPDSVTSAQLWRMYENRERYDPFSEVSIRLRLEALSKKSDTSRQDRRLPSCAGLLNEIRRLR